MIGTAGIMDKKVQGFRIDWGFGNLDLGFKYTKESMFTKIHLYCETHIALPIRC